MPIPCLPHYPKTKVRNSQDATHGIDYTQGNPTNHAHLINFDTGVVEPDSRGRLEYISQGFRSGECYLTCHGEEHSPHAYP